MKTNASNLVAIAERARKKVLFRACLRLVSTGISSFRKLGDGMKKLFSRLPRTPRVYNSGHSCSGFGQSIPNIIAKYFIFVPAPNPAGTNLIGSGAQHSLTGINGRSRAAAFTLVEAMIALGVMVLFTAACLSSIVVSQVSVRKAKEEAIAIDFLTKYTENIKDLPFTSVAPLLPINNIYNGANGAVLIAIPPANNPTVSVLSPANAPAYLLFYPDLLWFNNRNPTMTVTLTPSVIVGHDIEVNVKFDWDPPISKGGRQEVQVDFLRTKDTTQL